jgi:hypothetical protein
MVAIIFDDWLLGHRTNRIRKVEVERHETSTLAPTDIDHGKIAGRRHPLAYDSRDIVAGFSKDFGTAIAEVLIEFEIHALCFAEMSTNRSRDISAPYAMQAKMSDSSSPG